MVMESPRVQSHCAMAVIIRIYLALATHCSRNSHEQACTFAQLLGTMNSEHDTLTREA